MNLIGTGTDQRRLSVISARGQKFLHDSSRLEDHVVGCVNVYPWRQTDDTRSIEEMVAITAQHDSNA